MPTLDQFFASSAAIPLRGRPVRFRAVRTTAAPAAPGSTPAALIPHAVDIEALLFFVDERDRRDAERDADEAINALYKGAAVPAGKREEERALHTLWRALRTTEPPHMHLAPTVEALRGALVEREFGNVWAEYGRYISEEFPEYVDAADFGRLVEAAKGKALPDLLREFDSDLVLKSLPTLARLLAK